jgi:hypothetical protein
MRDLGRLIWSVLLVLLRSRAALAAENLVLRQQINVLRRTAPKRPFLSNVDRLIFVCLYRFPRCSERPGNCQAGDDHSLAPLGVQGLLALAIEDPRRTTEGAA